MSSTAIAPRSYTSGLGFCRYARTSTRRAWFGGGRASQVKRRSERLPPWRASPDLSIVRRIGFAIAACSAPQARAAHARAADARTSDARTAHARAADARTSDARTAHARAAD